MVGVAARACGYGIDVRHDFPFGIFRFVHVPVMTAHHGDVNSRASMPTGLRTSITPGPRFIPLRWSTLMRRD